MIPTVILVIVGVVVTWLGYVLINDTVSTGGMIILIVAAAVGIYTLLEHRRRP